LPAIFSRRADLVLRLTIVGFVAAVVVGLGATYYYASPSYTRVGYAPTQPVPFSHALHAGQLGLDCRYCHTSVEDSPHATLPAAQTCMNCHTLIKPNSPSLSQIREAWDQDPLKADNKPPVPWRRVHRVPDFAYFNHAAHVKAGVDCTHCHGEVKSMEVIRHEKPLTMKWCLECHRHPVETSKAVNPPQSCQGCHR
jgi:hypothetical protein